MRNGSSIPIHRWFVFVLLVIGAHEAYPMGAVDAAGEPQEMPEDALLISKWPDLTASIDSLFAPYDRPHSPGGVSAVLFEGEVIHLKGYGAANREFDVPWRPDTRYRIASITKTFVAHAMLLLEEQGKLGLDDPVRKHLPDFPDMGAHLTLRHLLTMTSGLWQDEILLSLAGATGPLDLDSMYEVSKRQSRLDYAPGSYFRYVDTNYRMLARIIEAVTKDPFPHAMSQLIFEPLGMTSTATNAHYFEFLDRQAPTYFQAPGVSGPLSLVDIHVPISGDGSLITTMEDIIVWLKHLRKGRKSTESSGSQDSLFDQLIQPFRLTDGQISPYRLGMRVVSHRGLEGWSHAGLTGTEYVYYPRLDLTVVHFSNLLGGIDPRHITRGMTDAFLRSKNNPHRWVLSDQNADRELEYFKANPSIPEAEVSRLVGAYAEAESGYFLTLHTEKGTDLSCTFLQAERNVVLIRSRKDHYQSDSRWHMPKLRIEVEEGSGVQPNLLVHDLDWSRMKRFVPVRENGELRNPNDYTGRYYSAELDVFYSVRHENNAKNNAKNNVLILRIGPGIEGSQRYRVVPLLRDVFQARIEVADLLSAQSLALKFQRDSTGSVKSMRLSHYYIRDLIFERMGSDPIF